MSPAEKRINYKNTGNPLGLLFPSRYWGLPTDSVRHAAIGHKKILQHGHHVCQPSGPDPLDGGNMRSFKYA